MRVPEVAFLRHHRRPRLTAENEDTGFMMADKSTEKGGVELDSNGYPKDGRRNEKERSQDGLEQLEETT